MEIAMVHYQEALEVVVLVLQELLPHLDQVMVVMVYHLQLLHRP